MVEQENLPENNAGRNSNLTSESPFAAKLPNGLEAGIGLAVASLVLGIISVPLSIIVIGAFTGLIGLILSLIHLGKALPFKRIVVWAMALCVISLISGISFGIRIYNTFAELRGQKPVELSKYVGTAAPDIELTDIEGQKIMLSQLKGRRVLLDFWATWCGPCQKEIPHLVQLRSSTNPDELVMIGISDEPEQIIKAFAQKNQINYTLVSTEVQKLPEPYGLIMTIPTKFIIDKEGTIQNILTGYRSLEDLQQNMTIEPNTADKGS